MENRHLAIALVVVSMACAMFFIPAQVHPGGLSSTTSPALVPGTPAAVTHGTLVAATPLPATGYPRTVLIEAFTGVWCPHCPAETQALHYIEDSTSRAAIDVPELHVCAAGQGSTPCLDNYVAPDNTAYTRGAWYNVCGYPDVFFDGQHDSCGATNSASQMQGIYDRAIANASAIPSNVSITDVGTVSSGMVQIHSNITSLVTGSYNLVSYLLEYIGKLNISNGGGPHDIDHVVRSTLANHQVSLVAGTTTEVDSSGAILSGWNSLNLSVVTFLQTNSTKHIENANWAPVTTMITGVSANTTTVIANQSASITIRVVNSSTTVPISGASVTLTADNGGTLSPSSGTTASDGTFTAKFTAPAVGMPEHDLITAQVSATNYTDGTGTVSLLVNPVVLSPVPTGLALSPNNLKVDLNWTTPATGGAGVTYHVYRATVSSGPYASVGTSTSTTFSDTNLMEGQSYWYKISAQNYAGFSANCSPIAATSVSVTPQGLPSTVGWWFSVDSMTFSSPTNDTLFPYLPSGLYTYEFGVDSYAYLAGAPGDPLSASGVSLAVSPTFTPRYANLQGTITPASANATATVNGVSIVVAAGAFSALLVAGTYLLNVSADGYYSNVTTVVLTPGNLTNVPVELQSSQSSGGGTTTSSGGLSSDEVNAIIIIAGVVGVAAIVGAAIVMSGRGRRAQASRTGRKGPRSPPPSPRNGP